LEVNDTIGGNTGNDTLVLTNAEGRPDLGQVRSSETMRVSSIENFDLHNSNILLELDDHLINSTDHGELTVITTSAPGTQTVDITDVDELYNGITLTGGVNKDVVIADDWTVNSFSTLNFDGSGVNSEEDTLIIVDEADISASDTSNIEGLDHIILRSE